MSTVSAILLFTDLANSVEVVQRAGDERVQRTLHAHHRLVQRCAAAHGGQEPRWLGDGFIAAFTTAAAAARCAIALQQAARRRPASERVPIRVALHVGGGLDEERDYFATPVVSVRRLCGHARDGQILASARVSEQLVGDATYTFREHGALPLDGMDAPLDARELRYQQDQSGALLTHTPFVGRTAELSRLAMKLREAHDGHGSVVMLVGEPGIGKTRMLEEMAETARIDNALVLWGRCYEGEAARPYGPFLEMLVEYAHAADDAELRTDLGFAAAPLARLAPILRQRLPDTPEAMPLQPDGERVRVLDAMVQFFLAVAQRAPLLLVLDDLHWADAGTIAMLRHVARFTGRGRLMVMGSYRDVDLPQNPSLVDTLGALPREAIYEHVPLSGLDSDEIAELLAIIADRAAPPPLIAAMASGTNGNPFFIREVLLHLREEGKLLPQQQPWLAETTAEIGVPHSVRQVIQRRLARLSDGARRLLDAASGFIGAFRLEIAATVAGIEDAPALDALDEALTAQLLRSSGAADTFDFMHVLVRHTIYAQLNAPRRARLHRQIAAAMEEHYGQRAVEHAHELAQHYHRSASLPGAERGAAYALSAAEQAERSTGYAEAAVYLRIALDLLGANDPRRARFLSQLAYNLALARDGEHALAAIRAAVPLIETSEGSAAAAGCLAVLLDPLFESGALPIAFEVARMGLRMANDGHDLIWASCAAIAVIERECDDPQHPGIAIDSAERREIGEIFTRLGPGAPSYAWTFMRRDCPPRFDDIGGDIYWRGEYRRNLPLLYDWASNTEQQGLIGLSLEIWAMIARCQIALGELAAAREALSNSMRLAQRMPGSIRGIMALAAEDELRQAVDEGWDERTRDGSATPSQVLPWHRASIAAAIARTHARRGRVAPALHRLHSVIPAIEQASGWAENYSRIAYDAAETLWLIERADYSETIERNIRDKVVAPNYRYPMTDARLALGRLCALQQRYDEATEWFAQARAVLDEQGARPLRAVVDYDEALMHLRRSEDGECERAQPLLAKALEQFRTLGMSGWTRRAEAMLAQQYDDSAAPDSEAAIEAETRLRVGADAIFRQEGDFWIVSDGSTTAHLRDMKGLHHIRQLLQHPGEELHVLDLVGRDMEAGEQRTGRNPGPSVGLPILDAEARSAYRRRLGELRAELAEAETFNDIGRAEQARAEIDALTAQLATAVGLGGRGRVTGGAAERARSTVTHAINAALRSIRRSLPALADDLALRLTTGTFCVYTPDPAHPTDWIV